MQVNHTRPTTRLAWPARFAISTWGLNLVHGLLSLDEATLVLSIPLSHTPVEDKIIWPFTPSGKYTIRSGSKFLTKLNSVQIPTANQQQ